MINKDFYNHLPSYVAKELDSIISQYQNEEWFNQAWLGYRIHILNSAQDKVMAPHLYFDRYIKDSETRHNGQTTRIMTGKEKRKPEIQEPCTPVDNGAVEQACEECKLVIDDTIKPVLTNDDLASDPHEEEPVQNPNDEVIADILEEK